MVRLRTYISCLKSEVRLSLKPNLVYLIVYESYINPAPPRVPLIGRVAHPGATTRRANPQVSDEPMPGWFDTATRWFVRNLVKRKNADNSKVRTDFFFTTTTIVFSNCLSFCQTKT